MSIKNRKCRRNYGGACNYPFQASKHKETDAYTCRYTGLKMAAKQMKWLLLKGQDLATSTPEGYHATTSFVSHFWVGDSRRYSVSLLASDADKVAHRASDKACHTSRLPTDS